ncbi:MAG: FAD binding domain-containing protein [Pseudotabrizicola sp.]|uniref:FAD binding domain-containing protein n=1 Tax=Pseudotabrizicola sp. TaxID=2939647 RepID=UPI0027303F70|nr:FAD binding domain-containing protein [Pseudotabrizicola sp.]MDP2081230.1 FAD binding domain-containing protein [Pseudotabrizicola sp.]MDZ7576151.1 FAD binding domain-containing protein [Pseudotabrizicola sp.]
MRDYARPQTLDEAVGLMAQTPRRILAGGTDLYPTVGRRIDGDILDLTAIPALCGITQGDGLRIGACTTWTMIAEAALPPALCALQQAARQVGGRQVQNMGTIGGNLCNASPAADGVPPLLALDAVVELAGPLGLRRVPLTQLLIGPRQTLRASDEILTAVILPASALTGRSAFVKLGARAYLVISIAMAAARIQVENGRITGAALAVGACSGVAQRLPVAEAALIGAKPVDAPQLVTPHDLAGALSPIDDIRATALYRRTAAAELLRRAIAEAVA